MSSIDSGIIDITVTRETTAVSRASFGIAILMGSTTPLQSFTERTKLYTKDDLASIAAMFGTSSSEYIAASKYFGQTPKPDKLRIGRRDTAVATVKKLVVDADIIIGNKINGVVNGDTLPEQGFDDDHLTTMTALAGLIAAIDGVASAVVGGSGNREITVTAEAEWKLTLSGFLVTEGDTQAVVTYATTTSGRTVEDDLIAAQVEVDDWYGVMITSSVDGALFSAADWTETQKKIFIGHTSAAAVKAATTTDIAAKFDAKNYSRSAIVWHHDTAEYIPAAIFGRCLPIDPGNSRFAQRQFSGITVTGIGDLDTTQKANVLGKKASVYIQTGGRGVLLWATTGGGDYLDTVRDIDYLESEVTMDWFQWITDTEKVPFTEDGIEMARSQVYGTLLRMARELVIDKTSISVTATPLSETTTSDRASRLLDKITFESRTTGGIQSVKIRGSVSV